jgi:hypothetical protein
MSASKKTTPKSNKSPAPATKPAAKKSPATKKAKAAPIVARAAAPASVPAPKTVPAPAPVAKSAAVAPPAAKPVAPKPVMTTIAAQIDVGFGNALFLRGEGPGLSWDRGVGMECVADDLWQITLAESARAYTFKFLVNDLTWSVGPDFTVACGTNVTLTPEF